MGSYVSIQNDTKDTCLVALGPDMKVLEWSIGALAALFVFVPVLNGLAFDSAAVMEAADEGTLVASEAGVEAGVEESEFAANLREFVQADRDMLDKVTMEFAEEANGGVRITAEVPDLEEIPEESPEPGEEPNPDKKGKGTWKKMNRRILAAGIMQGVSQAILKKYKSHYHIVQPGNDYKSGKKSLSLLMECNAVKIVHDGYSLMVYEAQHHVWSGATKNKVNHYKLSSHDFKWKPAMQATLQMVAKKGLLPGPNSPLATEVRAEKAEAPVARTICCIKGGA